jgi:hypothetical protein
MEMVKSLSIELEELEAEHEGYLFEENAENFLALEEDVLGRSIEDDDEDFTVLEALYYALEVLVVPIFDDYSDEEQHIHTSQFVDQRSNHSVYDNYESNSELDMQDIQEHTIEPYPLFIKEDYHEEINHPVLAEITEQQIEEQRFLTGPVYVDYESDPWESHEDEPKE